MPGERVVFVEENNPQQYVKLVASGCRAAGGGGAVVAPVLPPSRVCSSGAAPPFSRGLDPTGWSRHLEGPHAVARMFAVNGNSTDQGSKTSD